MAKGAPEPQQGGGGTDRSLDFLWLIALVVVVALTVWYFGKVYISMLVFSVKQYEIIAVNFVMQYWNQFAQALGTTDFTVDLHELNSWLLFIDRHYGADVDFKVLEDLSISTGWYTRFPAIFVLVVLGFLLYFGGISHKFKNTYDMQKLKFAERENWPQYSSVLKVDLVDKQLDEYPWAMAHNPMKFCKQYRLLNEEVGKDGKRTVSLRQGAAYRVLSLQLGPRWRGVKVLPDHLQALVAVFVARIDGDKKSADELLDQIAKSASSGKPKFYNFADLLAKHVGCKAVSKIFALHGYATTVMASLLVAAREAGVLSTAEFIWLKPQDRRMWYMLNSVGRYTAIAEISGAFAHWLAEKKLGLPLMVPMVEEAIKGLISALGEVIYQPDETA